MFQTRVDTPSTMADKEPMNDTECLIPQCSASGKLETFKMGGVKRLIMSASKRRDDEMQHRLETLCQSQPDKAMVKAHKTCYCTYNSDFHIKRLLDRKRKSISTGEDSSPAPRMRRSQTKEFDFKSHCLFCCEICQPIDPKNPGRWDKVVQCERRGIKDPTPFKSSILEFCSDRNDMWSREVEIRCHAVHDLAAAEAQYHFRCYTDFRRKPSLAEQHSLVPDDDALKLVINELYRKRNLQTWTSVELHDMYAACGGQLTRKHLFNSLVTCLGDAVITLHIHGCASIIGFPEVVGKVLNVAKLDNQDDEKEDVLVRQIVKEANNIPFSNKNYDLDSFVLSEIKQQTSPTLLRLVSKLVANGEITKTSLSITQCIQYNISHAYNQTTLGLGVQLHHKFGSRELIDTLHGCVIR